MPSTALIVTDMIQSYDFEDAEALAESARHALPGIARLIERAAEEDVLSPTSARTSQGPR